MADVISLISAGFGFLNNTIIIGQSLLTWLVIGVLFGMIGAFIRGKK